MSLDSPSPSQPDDERRDTLLIADPVLKHGFVQIPKVVYTDKNLSVQARFLYGALLCYAWQDEHCFPGQDALGDMMGMSARQVQTWMGELKTHGYLEVRRRGQGRTNVYTLFANPDTKYSSPLDTKSASPLDTKPTSYEVDTEKKIQRKKNQTEGQQEKTEPSEDVIRVFERFKSLIKPEARLGPAEAKKLEAGLKRHPVEDVLKAIEIGSQDHGNGNFSGWLDHLRRKGPAWIFLKPNRLDEILSTRPRNGTDHAQTQVEPSTEDIVFRETDSTGQYLAPYAWIKQIRTDPFGRPIEDIYQNHGCTRVPKDATYLTARYAFEDDWNVAMLFNNWDLRRKLDGSYVVGPHDPEYPIAIPLKKPHSGVSR